MTVHPCTSDCQSGCSSQCITDTLGNYGFATGCIGNVQQIKKKYHPGVFIFVNHGRSETSFWVNRVDVSVQFIKPLFLMVGWIKVPQLINHTNLTAFFQVCISKNLSSFCNIIFLICICKLFRQFFQRLGLPNRCPVQTHFQFEWLNRET